MPHPLLTSATLDSNTSILHFYAWENYLRLGWPVMKFTISCLLALQMLPSKLNKDWPRSSAEDVNELRMNTDTNPYQ